MPGHFISMNEHPHYKEVTALAKDSMTLGFLQRVGHAEYECTYVYAK